MALVLVPALVLMLAFAFSYVGAFHDPTPHKVPVAVVWPPAAATQLNGLPGDPLDASVSPSRADALSRIDDREVYGAYDVAGNRLFVASAANRATERRATLISMALTACCVTAPRPSAASASAIRASVQPRRR